MNVFQLVAELVEGRARKASLLSLVDNNNKKKAA